MSHILILMGDPWRASVKKILHPGFPNWYLGLNNDIWGKGRTLNRNQNIKNAAGVIK